MADAVLALHFAIVLFITAGLLLIWLGAALRWQWIRLRWPRTLHLGAICFVALESVVGITCPLTVWEAQLRHQQAPGGFIQQWVQRLMYYDLPLWVFTVAYVLFAVAVLATWWAVPPTPSARSRLRRDGAGG